MATGILASAQAWGEDPIHLSVVGYSKIPAGTSFDISRVENTQIASYVEERLKQALARRGFRYAKDANLAFSLQAEKIGGEPPPPTQFDPAHAQLHISIDTSGGKPLPGSEIGHSFRISLDLNDRRSGHYLWRGEITDVRPDVDLSVERGSVAVQPRSPAKDAENPVAGPGRELDDQAELGPKSRATLFLG